MVEQNFMNTPEKGAPDKDDGSNYGGSQGSTSPEKNKSELLNDKDVGGLTSMMEFYKRIKERSMLKQTPEAKENYLWHKKYLRRIQPYVMVLYIFFLPNVESPEWCNKFVQD